MFSVTRFTTGRLFRRTFKKIQNFDFIKTFRILDVICMSEEPKQQKQFLVFITKKRQHRKNPCYRVVNTEQRCSKYVGRRLSSLGYLVFFWRKRFPSLPFRIGLTHFRLIFDRETRIALKYKGYCKPVAPMTKYCPISQSIKNVFFLHCLTIILYYYDTIKYPFPFISQATPHLVAEALQNIRTWKHLSECPCTIPNRSDIFLVNYNLVNYLSCGGKGGYKKEDTLG